MASLNDKQIKYYKNLVNHHNKEGQRFFKIASETCIFIPDINDRDIAIALFSQAVVMSLNRDFITVLNILKTALIGYSINVYTQWQEMETNINWCIYHYQMRDFYQGILDAGHYVD